MAKVKWVINTDRLKLPAEQAAKLKRLASPELKRARARPDLQRVNEDIPPKLREELEQARAAALLDEGKAPSTGLPATQPAPTTRETLKREMIASILQRLYPTGTVSEPNKKPNISLIHRQVAGEWKKECAARSLKPFGPPGWDAIKAAVLALNS